MALTEITPSGAIKETLAQSNGLFTLYDSGYLGGTAASIDSGAGGFSTAYNHLRIIVLGRSSAAGNDTLRLQFNNDSASNYAYSNWQNTASSASDTAVSIDPNLDAANAITNCARITVIDVPFYAGTTFLKSFLSEGGGGDTVATTAGGQSIGGVWKSTSAINRVKVFPNTGPNFVAGSRMIIYGYN